MIDKYSDELYKLGFITESPVSFILKVDGERMMFIESNTLYNSLWVKITQGQYRMVKKEKSLELLLPHIKNEIRALKIRNFQ